MKFPVGTAGMSHCGSEQRVKILSLQQHLMRCALAAPWDQVLCALIPVVIGFGFAFAFPVGILGVPVWSQELDLLVLGVLSAQDLWFHDSSGVTDSCVHVITFEIENIFMKCFVGLLVCLVWFFFQITG